MRKKYRTVLVFSMAITMLLEGCGNYVSDVGLQMSDSVETEKNTEIKKPEKITMMVDGTLVGEENGRDVFEALWEEKTGIDLEIIQPEHDQYYDTVRACFEAGDLPDVVLLNSTYYTKYVNEQLIADITDYYEGSSLQALVKEAGKESLVDGIRIKGRLYGISPTRGNGCMTYIKKSWLENVGMQPPKTYEEYWNMIKAFSEKDPDGDGIMGNTYGVSAPGLINNEAPYTNYLPEFYQDAYPSFYQNEEGVWVDGFSEDAMKQAMERLRDAYQAGYIDPDVISNGTGDCRDKYYADDYGVFTYWAGTWAHTLSSKCKSAEIDDRIVALPAISETGEYLERVAPVWCITSKCKNPAGVYTYFLQTMLDGEDMELLWTYSPASDDYSKNHIDHMLSVVPLKEDPAKLNEDAVAALTIFDGCSKMADLPYGTDAYTEFNDELFGLKKDLINRVVTEGLSIEDAYVEYEEKNGVYMSDAIVDSFNAE